MDLQVILDKAEEFNQIKHNQFFVKMNSGSLPINIFLDSIYNFGLAIDEWSKVLGILLSKLPSYKERRIVLNNLLDENGEKSHVETFQEFIQLLESLIENIEILQEFVKSLSDGNEEQARIKTFQEFIQIQENVRKNSKNLSQQINTNTQIVKEFIKDLRNIVENNNWIYSVSAYAMIEYTYVNVSKCIYDYVSTYTKEYIPHYSVHEILDISHAKDLFSIVVPHLSKNSEDIYKGIEMGYNVLDKLFRSFDIN